MTSTLNSSSNSTHPTQASWRRSTQGQLEVKQENEAETFRSMNIDYEAAT